MEKLQSSFKNMALSLTIIAMVAAAALAGVYMLTLGNIEAQKKATSLAPKKETRRFVPWAAAASVLLLVGLAWFFSSRNNGMQMHQSPAFAEQDTIDMTDSITSEMLPYNEE